MALPSAFRWATGGALVALTLLSPAHAQRPVKLVVPFAVGGANDTVARILADAVKDALGPVVIENRPGPIVVSPDIALILVNPDLAPAELRLLCPISSTPIIWIVAASSPLHSVSELEGGELFGAPPAGTVPYEVGEALSRERGLGLVHVPYKNPAIAVADLMAGRIQVMLAAASPQLSELRAAGRVRIIGESERRLSLALFAGRSTGDASDVVAATRAALDDPGFRSRLAVVGQTAMECRH